MRWVVAIAVSFTALSCHTVLRPSTCPTNVESSGRSAIAWQHVGNDKGTTGTVLFVSTLDPITSAQVDLIPLSHSASNPAKRISNTHGEVSVDSLRPGKYVLRVRRIGFHPASDTVLTVADSGLVFRALMATDLMMLDGCGYGLMKHRVPWWVRK